MPMRHRSFHNYAKYGLSHEFGAALGVLVKLGRSGRMALMCSEAVWWRCHWPIHADCLLLNGHEVVHFMDNDREKPAKATQGGDRRPKSKIVYPVQVE